MTSLSVVSDRPVSEGSPDRRRHQRPPVALHGKLRTAGLRPTHCTIVDLSPGGACVETRSIPDIGQEVIIDIACIGRITGEVVRSDPFDFGIRFTICSSAKLRLANQITLQFNRERLHAGDRRVSDRSAQGEGADPISFSDGSTELALIKDVSLTGVAFISDYRPRIGLEARIGVLTGRVIRHLEDGYAVAFDPPSTPV